MALSMNRTLMIRSGGPRRLPELRQQILTLLVGTVLAGGMVGPDYRKPALTTPANWFQGRDIAAPRPPELARWWVRLNDPLLNELMEEAVAGNLDVATAKAKVREARASYRQTTGALYPTLTNSDAATRAKTADNSGSGSGAGTATTYQGGFDASWELDLFGANRRPAEAAS